MAFRAKVNGNEVVYKSRTVLEIIKQYISNHPNISYSELKQVFPDNLQGSIGVLKNEEEITAWENDGRSETREDRFFTKEKDLIPFEDNKIYVCKEWGDSEENGSNFMPFIEYVRESLGYDIEVLNDDNNDGDTERQIDVNNLTMQKIKNIILYGVPGVGKTHNIAKLIRLIEEGKSDSEIFSEIKSNETSSEELSDELKERTAFVTFHQSFGYEDFIEGFRPNKEGQITIQQGIFKQICRNANDNPNEHYYLIIDEINRGNISKIFGELITLIEEDKRDGLKVTLPYSKEPFSVPSNLYIIGTMNSTDKSIALIDVALRRRFTFLKMEPKAELIENDKARAIFEKLNDFLKERLDEDHQIGHSYFMKSQDDEDLKFVLDYKIKPLLEEYFYGDREGYLEAEAYLDIRYNTNEINEMDA